MSYIKWTPEYDAELAVRWNGGELVAVIAASFGCSRKAITNRADVLSLTRRHGKWATAWPEDREAELRKLWALGLSRKEMGVTLGVSSGSVSGMCARLGLGDNRTATSKKKTQPRSHRRLRPSAKFDARQPGTYEVLERAFRNLRHRSCHWPIGDPCGEEFSFCCAPSHGTYCADHARMGVLEVV